MYPVKLQKFLQESPQNRSLFSKALGNTTKFANTISKYLDLFKEFHAIVFPLEISNLDKIRWIYLNLNEFPKCPTCGSSIQKVTSSGDYSLFCNQNCYTLSLNNNATTKKMVKVNGEIYNSLKECVSKTKLSYFKLKDLLYSPDPNYEYYPNHTQQIEEEKKELETISKFLLDEAWLRERKKNNISINSIAKELQCKPNTVKLAFRLLNISTVHNQISEDAKLNLDCKEKLEGLYEKFTSEEIAKMFNVSPTSVLLALREHKISINYKQESSPERKVKELIESLGFTTVKDRTVLDGKEIDIYIPTLNLGFEVNGIYYHRDKPKLHQEKYQLAKKKGVRLIQIFEDDLDNFARLSKRIKHLLKVPKERVFARKCTVKSIDYKAINPFYTENHLFGTKACTFHFGLFKGEELVAAMSFNRNKLERFATSKTVVGGFSKLFSYAVKQLNLETVETFADLCWSDEDDNVYTLNEFKKVSVTAPNYFWVVNRKRHSRLKFQKHKLVNVKGYSPDKSEDQIMRENGAWKIYDAGHAKLVWTKR